MRRCCSRTWRGEMFSSVPVRADHCGPLSQRAKAYGQSARWRSGPGGQARLSIDIFAVANTGQSNMEYPMSDAFNGTAEREASDYPSLRMLDLADRPWPVPAGKNLGSNSCTKNCVSAGTSQSRTSR